MAHHLGGKRRGEGAGARDLFRAGTVERLHDRVEQFRVGIGGVEDCPDFVVDPGDDFGAEEPLEDHRPIPLDDGIDRVGIRGQSVNVLDRGRGSHRRNAPYLGGVPTFIYRHELLALSAWTRNGVCGALQSRVTTSRRWGHSDPFGIGTLRSVIQDCAWPLHRGSGVKKGERHLPIRREGERVPCR